MITRVFLDRISVSALMHFETEMIASHFGFKKPKFAPMHGKSKSNMLNTARFGLI